MLRRVENARPHFEHTVSEYSISPQPINETNKPPRLQGGHFDYGPNFCPTGCNTLFPWISNDEKMPLLHNYEDWMLTQYFARFRSLKLLKLRGTVLNRHNASTKMECLKGNRKCPTPLPFSQLHFLTFFACSPTSNVGRSGCWVFLFFYLTVNWVHITKQAPCNNSRERIHVQTGLKVLLLNRYKCFGKPHLYIQVTNHTNALKSVQKKYYVFLSIKKWWRSWWNYCLIDHPKFSRNLK